ncbi:MAG: VWA domain-containing protein [Thermoanaerobaculia bacterium]
MIRAAAVALLILSSSVVRAAELPWHSAPDTAAAVARAQRKLLLIYYRGACDRCNDKLDATFEAAAADDVFTHALDSYVPLRVTARTAVASHPLLAELVKRKAEPLIALYDASGALLIVLEKRLSFDEMVEELLRFRGQRARIIQSVELRLAGRTADADMVLGNALLEANAALNAADRLGRAAKEYRQAKSEELAQIAEIQAGGAWYMAGFKPRGRKVITEIAARPFSDAVAAEAYMMAGSLHEAESKHTTTGADGIERGRPSVVMDQHRLIQKAITAYRKAYALAEPGTTALQYSRSALARLDDQPLPPRKSESQSRLRLVLPARATLIGDTDFQVEAMGEVASVDYFLDNVKVASSTKPPFRVTFDVGHVPSARTVKAVAFNASGTATSEATVAINDRIDAFLVSIVSPASAWVGGASDVELDIRVPPGRKVSRVDVSWNGKDIAALTSAPFHTRIDVPRGEFGYLRAVATLDDGATAETTKIYNASGVSESVEVGNVTVIATVNDAKGERIAGLTSRDFSIRDEGEAVTPELRSTDDDPVTIGIAVDSSSSMAGRQLYVIRAATQFLGRALRPQDQAFVVSFDTGARLVHPRSSDAASLRESVYALTPQGGTSIFDGVTFALQQFQGITGKKALLVFSDGWEGTSSASARECERLARAVGVPVYVVVPPGGMRNKNALAGIAALTGGTMFYGEPRETFPAMFDRLAAEMRGQYVLSFTRPAGIRTGAWRSIRVSVDRRDANVRAIQGYRAN